MFVIREVLRNEYLVKDDDFMRCDAIHIPYDYSIEHGEDLVKFDTREDAQEKVYELEDQFEAVGMEHCFQLVEVKSVVRWYIVDG